MGRAERRVVLTLLSLGLLGQSVRLLGTPDGAPGGILAGPARRADPGAHRARSADARTELRAGQRLDPDRATAEELARLPGIGMRLAKEIVADREIRGFFGSPEALARVDGIGPATVRRVEPFLRFARPGPPADRRVNLNRATLADLERLPGIGPSRARAILAYRERHGPFADPADLERVPGISPRLAARLTPSVRVRRRARAPGRVGPSTERRTHGTDDGNAPRHRSLGRPPGSGGDH